MILANIAVILPVLDEAETIAGVIHNLQQLGLTNICVADNGSCDRTAEIAAQAGAQVVCEPQKGYGQACWRGLQSPIAAQAKWILFCDGDGSDDLSQLPELLALGDRYDFVLANRRATKSGKAQLTPAQNFGNWLATRLIQLGWKHAYQDLGPLRLIRKGALDCIAMENRGFGWTVEMQVRAVEEGLSIFEYPANYRPRQGGQSKISGTIVGSFKAGQVILATLANLYGKRLLQSSLIQTLLLRLSAICLVAGSIIALPYGDFLSQPNAVPLFWRGIGLMGAGFVMSWGLRSLNRWWFWGVAIALRLILLAMHPGDDIWRYLWEGHIQNLGFNPYLLAPDADVLAPFRFAWWNNINHPHLPAIYPPVAQLGFRFLSLIHPSVLIFKSAFVAADIGICALLSRRFGYLATLLYAWNPLILYSFAGGGHYDSWFLLPLVFAWLSWDNLSENISENIATKVSAAKSFRQAIVCSLGVGFSIALKWMSLPVLGFLAWQTRQRVKAKLGGLVGGLLLLGAGAIPMAIATLPFCQILYKTSDLALSCPVIPLSSPFVSHGRSAALIAPLLEDFFDLSSWPNLLQTNVIYAIPLALWVLWSIVRAKSFGQFAEHYLVVLMLLSPIIHAWYFTWLVPFAVASRNWGTRLISLSAFCYFALPYGMVTGNQAWVLSDMQRWGLWGPFLLGLVISATSKPAQSL